MHYGMGLNVCINNTNIIERLWVHETWALTSLHEWIIQKNDLQHTETQTHTCEICSKPMWTGHMFIYGSTRVIIVNENCK